VAIEETIPTGFITEQLKLCSPIDEVVPLLGSRGNNQSEGIRPYARYEVNVSDAVMSKAGDP
jgi:hypothetical protein